MNDILPPKRPLSKPAISSPPKNPKTAPLLLEEPVQPPLLEAPKRRSKLKASLIIVGGILAAILITVVACVLWYQAQLRPLDLANTDKLRITIASGSSPSQIGDQLEKDRLIRSSLAFDIYTRLAGVRSALQAGTYSLSPSESVEQIVKHLTSGKVDQFSLTFLPGGTLSDHRTVLIKAGFSAAAVDEALKKTYDHPLFRDKPAGTDLEGYIYGETYNFETTASLEEILTRTFDEFYGVIEENDLINKFSEQGFNLYEGLTLASIIQKEVSRPADQKQVAQVFLKRLREDMPLGADATFVYGAKKLGLSPSVDLDSPYNTRIHAGLPPGPIASPGIGALQALAAPASGDYLFFVSGDDGTTHFARTQAEHDANTQQYCHANCRLF